MSTNSKVSQDSDEYRKWKDGVSKSSSKLKSPSEIEEVDISFREINQVLRDRIILGFDDFFGVTDYQDRAKKIYYLINFSVYYSLCCLSAYFYYNYSVQDYQFPILFIMLVGLITAITVIFSLLLSLVLLPVLMELSARSKEEDVIEKEFEPQLDDLA